MKPRLILFLVVIFPGLLNAQERRVGVNLAELSPFATQWIYTDAMKQAGEWQGRIPGELNSFVEGLNIPVLDNGYPVQVPFELDGITYQAQTSMFSTQPGPWFYPAGNYQLIFEGDGEIEIGFDVDGNSISYTEPSTVHNVPINNPTGLGVRLTIIRSDSANPIQNIRFIFPGEETDFEETPFHPLLLELIEPFPIVRFMKPIRTENNTIENWEDRTTTDFFAYTSDKRNAILPAMPYEDVIRLSNQAQKDPWLSIPYRVSDDYVDSLATMLFNNLDPNLRIHLEYSNEAWNPSFAETRQFMIDRGVAANYSEFEDIAGYRYFVQRSLEIFAIFDDVFAGQEERLVQILGSQSDSFTAMIHLEALEIPQVNPNNQMPDAISVAAYAGVLLIDSLEEQNVICSLTAEDVADSLLAQLPIEFEEMYAETSRRADSLGIQLFAYEGGQHVAALGFVEASECAAPLIEEVNRLPEMEAVFCSIFDEWFDTHGGAVLMSFNLAESYNSFGAFGLLESMLQDRLIAPKWVGHQNCAFSMAVNIEDDSGGELPTETTLSQNYPNPFNPTTNINFAIPEAGHVRLEIFDLLGRKVSTLVNAQQIAGRHTVNFDASVLSSGVYIYRLQVGGTVLTRKLTLIR